MKLKKDKAGNVMKTSEGKDDVVPESGNKTEIAMLKFIRAAGCDYETYRSQNISATDPIRIPFSSARKRMSTIIVGEGVAPTRLLIKGASEYVVKSCDKVHYWDVNLIVN